MYFWIFVYFNLYFCDRDCGNWGNCFRRQNCFGDSVLQLYTHVFLYLCIFYHGNNQSYCITSLRALFSASSALVTGNLWLLFWCSTAQPAYNIQAEWILCLRSSSVCVLQDFNRFEIRSGGILQKQTQVPQKQRCVPPIPPGQIHTQDVYGHWSFVAR